MFTINFIQCTELHVTASGSHEGSFLEKKIQEIYDMTFCINFKVRFSLENQ